MPTAKKDSAKASTKAARDGETTAREKVTRARLTETIKFLTLDETKRLFAWITDKRDKAIFLIAYRHGLRASEIGLLQTSATDGRHILRQQETS